MPASGPAQQSSEHVGPPLAHTFSHQSMPKGIETGLSTKPCAQVYRLWSSAFLGLCWGIFCLLCNACIRDLVKLTQGGSLGVGGGGRFFSASGRALSAISFGVSKVSFGTSGNLNSGPSAGFLGSGGCKQQPKICFSAADRNASWSELSVHHCHTMKQQLNNAVNASEQKYIYHMVLERLV